MSIPATTNWTAEELNTTTVLPTVTALAHGAIFNIELIHKVAGY
jgi:hypothetical protein